jgi:PAS domain S-box-containing protein
MGQSIDHDLMGWTTAIIDSSQDAIISKTLDGRIRTWNKAAEKTFGYRAEEVVGQPMMLIIPPELRGEEEEILGRISCGERVDHLETVRLTRDGRRVDISAAISPIKDASGKVIGASNVAREITQRKLAELERERILRREQESCRRLAEAVAARDEFLAMAAHELRKPLHVFRLMLFRLYTSLKDAPEVTSIHQKCEGQLDRLSSLVDRLLDVARAQTGQFDLHIETFDLCNLVREVVGRFSTERPEIPIYTDLDETIAGRWDRLWIDEALTNLLSNAIKYGNMKPIVARAFSVDGYAILKVCDGGSGIRTADLERIFDRFERATHQPEDRTLGIGLGLWITKRIAEAHGGTVSAESEFGNGSVFTLTLPTR